MNGTTNGADYIDYLGVNSLQLINSTNYLNKELMFSYTYDQYKQLATSSFGTYTNSTNTFSLRNEYKESGASGGSITYDANGNITRLQRSAYTTTAGLMYADDLTYTNGSANNRLTSILDAAQNTLGNSSFKTTSTVTPQSLTYNSIGQLTANASESVSTIDYYPNGKPKKITFTTSNYTEYYYDDNGDKYKTVFYNSGAGQKKITWYAGPGLYVLDESISTTAINLDEMNTPVGQIKRNGSVYDNVYSLSDHLGNVRVTFKESGTGNGINLLSYNDYYAWGGTLPGRAYVNQTYRYGYQGQEKSADGSLWDQFELRLCNHDLGRWMAPDPYGQFHSPYLAMGNNPVNMIDPDGGYMNSYGTGASGGGAAKNETINFKSASQVKFFFGAIGHTDPSTSGEEKMMTMLELMDGMYGGGGGGGGGANLGHIFGEDPFSGGLDYKSLTKGAGVAETEEQFNQSIAPSYYDHVSQKVENNYNDWVAHLGEGYNPTTGTYGYYQKTGSNGITVTGNTTDGYTFSEVSTGLEWVSSNQSNGIPGLSIQYDVFQPGQNHYQDGSVVEEGGVYINVNYTVQGDPSNYRWSQYVTTNKPNLKNYNSSPQPKSNTNGVYKYFDGRTGTIFFYKDKEMKNQINGNTVNFWDTPKRNPQDGPASWSGYLTLWNGDQPVFSISYGFDNNFMGQTTATPYTVIKR